MNIRKTTFIITTVVICLLILLSCNKKVEPLSTENILDQNFQHLKVALTDNPNTLDPQATTATITAQVTKNIYDTLIQDEKATPLLAESWSLEDGGTTWKIHLKKGVVFHHGKAFTSEDVVATFTRIKEDSSSPFYEELKNFVEIIAEDEHTVIVKLETITSAMPYILASNHMAIMPADLIMTKHNFARNPVGTGPFKFIDWVNDSSISLERNENYHLQAPSILEITLYIISDVTAQTQALMRSDIDIMPYVIEPQLSQLKNEKDISVMVFPGSTILVLAMNNRTPPLNNLSVRKAIAQVIDKQKVIDIAYPGSKIVNSFWHSNSPYFTYVPEIFDPNASKLYFKANPIAKKLTITVPSSFAPHVRAAQLYQTMLEQVGLSVEVAQVNWATWLSKVYGKGDFEMTVIGHTAKIHPGQRLEAFTKNGGYVGWQNTEFKKLINDAKVEMSLTRQIELYKQAFSLMTQEYPFVFIAENSVNIAMRNRVKNLYFDPIFETYDFRNVNLVK